MPAFAAALFVLAAVSPQQPPARAAGTPVTFAALLGELDDLERLTRWPDPEYTTVQWSSTDRRTVAPDQPGWFANADGFGGEPQPNFAAVLRAPGADGIGEFLVGDVDGPGAIVRGWSAGMAGTLRVWLDGSASPLFTGTGYDFLARRSAALVPGFPKLPEATRRLLQQEDADYLPIPFAQHLRVTWTGSTKELHFYQLQVRRYATGTAVATFAPQACADVVQAFDSAAGWAAGRSASAAAPDANDAFALEPGAAWHRDLEQSRGGELQWFGVQLDGADRAAWRSLLLRIAFDGSPTPQVEAPLGDFSGAGPGLPPLHSAAFDTRAGLECRWPMPFQRRCRIELVNHGGAQLRGRVRWALRERTFDEGSLYFHALWRIDRELSARAAAAPIDLPYAMVQGHGRLVGLACQITNPPMHPDWRSNWWGEGDEKIAVDGAFTTFGTGSEDYFNYSWSHWRYFDFAFCGQPLSTGPGNCGFASNHRLQIVDDLPFQRSLAASLELWTHKPVTPLGYARIAWFYARPGALTDHRAIQPIDLTAPALPPWRDEDFAATDAAATWPARSTKGLAADGRLDEHATSFARSGSILWWSAPAGGELRLPFAVPQDGAHRLRLSMQQRPDAPAVQVLLDGELLRDGNNDTFALQCVHGERFEDLVFSDVPLVTGAHTLALRCARGDVGIDLIGWERTGKPVRHLDGAVEAEQWPIVRQSDGLAVEVQDLGAEWSGGLQRWVRATRAGDSVTFAFAAKVSGRHRVALRLTTSWDYGIVRIDWNGARAAADVDLFCGADHRIGVREVDLGERDLAQPAEITFTVVGHAEGSAAPHCYFGIDCAVLRRP